MPPTFNAPAERAGTDRIWVPMAKTIIHYDALWADALRGIVRHVLREAEGGLPGGHHFYVTFRTRHPDVDISPALRARFPDEMTIVLQHQFWGLEVSEDWFEVTLSFNRVNERLHVPLSAVCAFADPFAKFGIQIPTDASIELPSEALPEEIAEASEDEAPLPASASDDQSGRVVTLDAFRKK
jgi:hypothetical protein